MMRKRHGALFILLLFIYNIDLNLNARATGSESFSSLLENYNEFSDSTQLKLENFFDYHHKIVGDFNGSYLFYSNDSIHYGTRGYSIYSNRDSVEPSDLFQLASVSKVFTSMSVMMLHQDGYLNVNDSVHWYIPELNTRNLTIRHLLSHTSGLPDYFYVKYRGFEIPKGQKHLKNEDVIDIINRQPKRVYSRFGFYDYSNTNYVLLSMIVERVSNTDFRSFVKRYICETAEMKYTHICNFDSLPLVNYPVQGYRSWRVYEDIPENGTTGDKGVYSSVFEMFNLERALRGSYILHKSTKEEMWTPQTVTSADSYYAMGWRVKWIDGKKWVFHNGWWKGFRTYFWICLDEDKSFVVLTNNVEGRFLSTLEMVGLLK